MLLQITKTHLDVTIIVSGVTFSIIRRPVSTKDFDFIRDCKISNEL